ncbi:pancreatic triacylglycerol lipase-like [Armigeres subalbatus]|uniref:pancreatic triacylglycerol lipase-like n=1 Tax=Armigeres subalbatus TaxID=124917 RepID=UPI002ED1B572
MWYALLVLILVPCGLAEFEVRYAIINRESQELVYITQNNDDFAKNGCNPNDSFALVIHGWRDGPQKDWVIDVLSNLTVHRGGCIMYMSYGNETTDVNYFRDLYPKFDLLVNSLTQYLQRLEALGFDPDDGFIYGFSFGANIALEAGRRFGLQRIGRIDVCEPTSIQFDNDKRYFALDPKLAAKKVQCIHTSKTLGTRRRDCHVSWSMGSCGEYQSAAGPFPKGPHGLCPHFYNSAFTHRFLAVPKPNNCYSNRYALRWPLGFRMGYFCDMESGVHGELFAATTKNYPYNEDG